MNTAVSSSPFKKNHMEIHWHEYARKNRSGSIIQGDLLAKASIIGRVGIMMLSCGTGAWRVRSSMNELSELMGVTCTVDIGLMSINYTCFDGDNSFSQSLCLTNTGVNTSQLNRLEKFVSDFQEKYLPESCDKIHTALDEIQRIHGLYSPLTLALAAALACGSFTFLLGGGIIEMLCAFFGAGIGNFIRCKLSKHHFTLFLCITASIACSCLTYTALLKLLELIYSVNLQHEAGYICSMLFIIPGFPFITSGIDLAKLDIRSGTERLTYSLIIITVATMTSWILSMLLGLKPLSFLPLHLALWQWILFRLLASFCGVFGFSIMFNSPSPAGRRSRCYWCRSQYHTAGIYRSSFSSTGCCRFHRCLSRRYTGFNSKRCCRLSENFHYRSFHCHHGTRTISVPWFL